jgi:hypothetical protein
VSASGKSDPGGQLGGLRVALLASGKDYQAAAAWAAATYAQHAGQPDAVSVFVPNREILLDVLKTNSQRFGFAVQRFPFRTVSEAKFTSQLKCQWFLFCVSRLRESELLFLVDADTYCLKPLRLLPELAVAISEGKIGLAPDIEDRHFRSPAQPWYLAPQARVTYVKSGVILASRKALPLFRRFRQLSEQPRFLHGPFNDQKVINFALGKYFRHNLVLLDTKYNGIRHPLASATVIGHCAGGAGRLGQSSRKSLHLNICTGLLDGCQTLVHK